MYSLGEAHLGGEIEVPVVLRTPQTRQDGSTSGSIATEEAVLRWAEGERSGWQEGRWPKTIDRGDFSKKKKGREIRLR